MAVTARKYNPGFLSVDELVTTFCVRTAEYDSLVETLIECSGSANTHQIVIGPRGSGKTSLLLRVAAEVLRDADLSARFFAIVFAEESYEVSTAGEFWLECVSRLADQAPRREGVDLQRTFEELRTIADDRMLEDRCLGVLQDFADREKKRLVLVVENLNMMFRDMGDGDAGWRLRKVLQTEPRIILLASATSRFNQMDDPKEALYELFRVIRLQPLDTKDCETLWQTVSGQTQAPQTIQALRILTGGSPRLLTIVARFGANLSFHELMADLLDLVDDHTEYFKSHLDALPAQERRVYLALADLWKPANTREIAERARLGTSKCSAHLARLVERGAVEVSGGSARRKLYYLTERLYNIYYLMRRARGPVPLIDALIRFMEAYYSTDQLKEFGDRMVREALGFDGGAPTIYRMAFERLVQLPSLEAHREELLSQASPAFAYAPNEFSEVSPALSDASELFKRALALVEDDRLQDVVAVLDEIIRTLGKSDSPTDREQVPLALVNKGNVLAMLGRAEEALQLWSDVTERFGGDNQSEVLTMIANAQTNRGVLLEQSGRYEEALAVWQQIEDRFGTSDQPEWVALVARSFVQRCTDLFKLNRTEEALSTCDRAMDRFEKSDVPDVVDAVAAVLFNKGVGLIAAQRNEEALAVWDEIERRFGNNDEPEISKLVAWALVNKGFTLTYTDRCEDAVGVWNEVVRRFGKGDTFLYHEAIAKAALNRMLVLDLLNRPDEALEACDEIFRRFGSSNEPYGDEAVAQALVRKGTLLVGLDRTEEGFVVWDEVVQRFEASDVPTLRGAAETALYGQAQHELNEGRAKSAIAFLDRALLSNLAGVPDSRLQGHLIRARAHLAGGDGEACVGDVEVALSILPALNMLPRDVLEVLADLAGGVGPERMCDLIKSSPADDLLLPLRTALERELGLEPRVAREVEEIAEDIRRELLDLRKSEAQQQTA